MFRSKGLMLVGWLSKVCSLRRVDFDKLKTKFGWPLITVTEQLSLSKFWETLFFLTNCWSYVYDPDIFSSLQSGRIFPLPEMFEIVQCCRISLSLFSLGKCFSLETQIINFFLPFIFCFLFLLPFFLSFFWVQAVYLGGDLREHQ